MNKLKVIYRLLFTTMLLMGLIFTLILSVTYIKSKYNAVKYLQIVTICDEESYQSVKSEIYYIIPINVRKTLFKMKNYEGPNYPPTHYTVNSITGCMKGYNHYVFRVNWTINDYYTINSILYIRNGIVYNTNRKP